MSTVTDSVAATDAAVVLTGRALFDQQTKDFGAPPEGHNWKRTGKGDTARYILDDAGLPIPVKKTKKVRKPKKEYTIPGGKIPMLTVDNKPVVTPGFIVGTHAKLKVSDFTDVLDYAHWNVWYQEQMLERAKSELKNTEALGKTPEQRNANVSMNRAVTTIDNALAALTAGGGDKAGLLQRLQELLAKNMVG